MNKHTLLTNLAIAITSLSALPLMAQRGRNLLPDPTFAQGLAIVEPINNQPEHFTDTVEFFVPGGLPQWNLIQWKTRYTFDNRKKKETKDKITYTKAGTYTYTVVEEKGTATSWEYSKDVWTIIVEVVDKNGKLEKNVSYKLNGATFTVGGNGKTLPLSFTNVYKPGVHTGDNTDTRPFVFAMGISGMLLLGLGAFGVKNRKKGKKGA